VSDSDPFVGKLFGGRWLVERPLSSGGMGTIYVATHSETGRPVALKVIQSQAARNDEFVARFKRETGALARVSHPNVVTFLDSGAQDGTLYLVMELLEGKSLRSIMGAPVAWQRAFLIAADVCKALAAVHKIGIVHRDLKPENIFLQEAEGHDELAKLIDFGIVRLHDHASATMATSTGNVVGTPGYISPEQLQGQPASAASDVYAVGVILYELITGKFPFAAPTPHAMLVKQLIDPLPPPRNALPSVPKHVEDTILRFIERDSQLRIQNAKDGLAVLNDALKRSDLAPDQATETGDAIALAAQNVIAQHTPAPLPGITPAPVPTAPTGIHPVKLPPPVAAKKEMSPGSKFALVAGLVFMAFCVTCGMCGVIAIVSEENKAKREAREAEHHVHEPEVNGVDEDDVDMEVLGKALEAAAVAGAQKIEEEAKKAEAKADAKTPKKGPKIKIEVDKNDANVDEESGDGPTRKEVREFVNSHLKELAACWDMPVAEIRESLIEGDEAFIVKPDGTVLMQSLIGDHSTNPKIECSQARISKWRMAPFNGKPIRVKLNARDDDKAHPRK
jgi:hypothetical protein